MIRAAQYRHGSHIMSFRVAVFGKQPGERWFQHQYGIQVFDLSVDQICSLLENTDPKKGTSHVQLGASPSVQYHVMSGGRFFPSVSREEIAQVMQGVDILVTFSTSPTPWFHDFLAQEFFQCLTSDNLLDRCKAVVVRIVPEMSADLHAKLQTMDDILKMGKCKSKRKSKKIKLDDDVTTVIAQLCSRLLGEEIKAALTAPVKETMSAGKALLDMGQRLTSWVTSLVKS